jgi:hypothetical protein
MVSRFSFIYKYLILHAEAPTFIPFRSSVHTAVYATSPSVELTRDHLLPHLGLYKQYQPFSTAKAILCNHTIYPITIIVVITPRNQPIKTLFLAVYERGLDWPR